jgi:myo-inositol-1(or 4)-monophosphatase
VDEKSLVELLFDAAGAARSALDGLDDWGPNGEREGQYRLDVAADHAVVRVLGGAGLPILSEESGSHPGPLPMLAVVDPIDGSTNAHRGLPMYSTSICVFDHGGPWVGVVKDHVSGHGFHAVRGQGAWRDGSPIRPSDCRLLSRSIVGVSGVMQASLGSWQYRALGCASLELCAVAEGSLDAYLPVGSADLRPWDYQAGALICLEAGAALTERANRDLWVREAQPRAPAAAATEELLAALLEAVARSEGR